MAQDKAAVDKKKNMPPIKTYASSDDDDGVVEEIFTRKPSERRSKPSIEALKDQHKDFFVRYTIPKLPGSTRETESEEASSEDHMSYRSPPLSKPKANKRIIKMVSHDLDSDNRSGSNSVSSLSSDNDDLEDDKVPLAKLMKHDHHEVIQSPTTQLDQQQFSTSIDKTEIDNHLLTEEDINTTVINGFTIFFEEAKKIAQVKNPQAGFEKIRETVFEWWQKLDKNGQEQYETKARALKRQNRAAPLSVKNKRKEKFLEKTIKPPPVETESVASKIRDIPPARKIVRCARERCNNIAIEDARWNGQYCSTACVVHHCENVLHNFIQARKDQLFDDDQNKMDISDDNIFETSDVILMP